VRRAVVVKLGSSLVAGPGGRVRRSILANRAREIAVLVREGTPVCVVSSGAIALGLPRLGVARRPRSLPKLQAASALGQARLQAAWDRALAREGIATGQVLLTASDVADRAAYLNARHTLQTLFALGAVPVVNENDATATDEITFGDNDALAAQVALLVHARLLLLLTEVEGVYTHAPGTPGAEFVARGDATADVAFGRGSPFGRGGMGSKIVAARLAASAGIRTVIAGGTGRHVLLPILAGEPRGTRFAPEPNALSAFKLWLLHGKPVAGRLHVDAGARRAVVEKGASLLAVGVAATEGRFEAGDAVELLGPDGRPFAKGIADAAAGDLGGRPRGVEAVHRDRLVLLPDDDEAPVTE
jgi:glutamate 5-kinase